MGVENKGQRPGAGGAGSRPESPAGASHQAGVLRQELSWCPQPCEAGEHRAGTGRASFSSTGNLEAEKLSDSECPFLPIVPGHLEAGSSLELSHSDFDLLAFELYVVFPLDSEEFNL